MSFLAPLYVLGALGIGLPILFHLIRRQPRGQRTFSSLMFLRPTPPTLTRRSRLENWPLLLLRAMALILLACAFARPFLRSPLVQPGDAPGKRMVLLIDTSASMRRDGLWPQALRVTSDILKNLQAADQVAIVAFDLEPRVAMSLEQSTSLDLDARRQTALQAIEQIQPGWAASDLGSALILAADLLSTTEADASLEVATNAELASSTAPTGHIIVVSDMQTGGEQNLKSLQAYSWPKDVKTEVRSVVSARRTNAVATVLRPSDQEEVDKDTQGQSSQEGQTNQTNQRSVGKMRVRVSNSVDATAADFSLVWADANGAASEATRVPVHVGPGESQVVRIDEPRTSLADTTALQLVLHGDDHDFDNARYLARPVPVEQQLLYIGPTSAEPRDSLLYYLQRAPLDNRQRSVAIETAPASTIPAALNAKKTPLVIVAQPLADPAIESLKRYVSSGGGLLWVLDGAADLPETQRSLSLLADAPELSIREAAVSDYAMLSRIDFAHPVFRPFADARFNDFSKIRFWSHRMLSGLSSAAGVIATFDDGSPALVQQPIGQGQLWIVASGWQPTNSQLALSTKFVPLIAGLYGFGNTATADTDQVTIGQTLPFAPSPTARIEREGDAPFDYRDQNDPAAVTRPGFYRYVDGDRSQLFAVNVDESESRTEPLANDELERHGVAMGTLTDGIESMVKQRQQRDVELEGRQRLWQWILLGVLGLLALESWLSGYLDRRQQLLVNSQVG